MTCFAGDSKKLRLGKHWLRMIPRQIDILKLWNKNSSLESRYVRSKSQIGGASGYSRHKHDFSSRFLNAFSKGMFEFPSDHYHERLSLGTMQAVSNNGNSQSLPQQRSLLISRSRFPSLYTFRNLRITLVALVHKCINEGRIEHETKINRDQTFDSAVMDMYLHEDKNTQRSRDDPWRFRIRRRINVVASPGADDTVYQQPKPDCCSTNCFCNFQVQAHGG